MNEVTPVNKRSTTARSGTQGEQRQYVSITIGEQMFGIPVLIVHDVLGPQRITRVPLASAEVAGSLNLRGRIVTAIDVRLRLGLPPRAPDTPSMSVVVDFGGEFYSLMVDAVGEVLTLSVEAFERSPATLSQRWREISLGIYRLNDQLLIIPDINQLLDFARVEAA